MSQAEQFLQDALNAFDFGGQVVGAVRYGSGHINDTFCVHTQPGEDPCRRFILQRISSAAFHHPEQVMANIVGVTSYLGKVIAEAGGDPTRETMCVYATKDGKNFYTDPEGGAWRVYPFIEDTKCLQSAETPELFAASALAFGRFQQMLSDFPSASLFETIPDFHNTPLRYQALLQAVQADPKGRLKNVSDEMAFFLDNADDYGVAERMKASGELPLRVTHNDTKLNNIMIDDKTGEGICVIDLDTIMPGLSIFDFGDSIRFGANTAAEDEQDVSKVSLSLPLFESYTKGFLAGCAGSLTRAEVEMLPMGAKLMTLECGIRFLADYLMGDTYFKTAYPEHNLVRARTQIALVADMEEKWGEMENIVARASFFH